MTVNRYTAAVDTGQPPRKRMVEVLEIDIQALRLPHSSAEISSAWPSVVSRIDGVMVCYDATNVESLEGLREVVREYWPTEGGDESYLLLPRRFMS